MAEIELRGVTKRYPDGTEAVTNIDLTISDGELMILVGPSGCGKTTTLRMIAGLEEITSGTLRIGGRVVNNLVPKDRDIAMVFQSYALYPHMSVRENMGFALRLAKVKKREIDKRVNDAAATLDLTEHIDRKPANLSGGQRQRVAMGRAIVRDPQAFLMDEPLSNLDAQLRVQMRIEVARLQQRLGTTTVYVTHDQVEAMTLGHRVAVMNQGLIQQVETPQGLYNDPVNLFVARFIGSPPINLLPARVTAETIQLPFGEFLLPDELRRRLPQRLASNQFVAGVRPEAFAEACWQRTARRPRPVHPSDRRGRAPWIGDLHLLPRRVRFPVSHRPARIRRASRCRAGGSPGERGRGRRPAPAHDAGGRGTGGDALARCLWPQAVRPAHRR